jgi:hypothetical protein
LAPTPGEQFFQFSPLTTGCSNRRYHQYQFLVFSQGRASNNFFLVQLNGTEIGEMMKGFLYTGICLTGAAAFALSGVSKASAATVNWDAFAIRPTTYTNTTVTEDGTGDGLNVAVTTDASTKVGYGTDYFNGKSLSAISTVTWDLVSGTNIEYLNLWVTDGNGNYTDFSPDLINAARTDFVSGGAGMLNGVNLQTAGAMIFETDFSADTDGWLTGTGAYHLADITGLGQTLTWADGPNAGKVATLAEIAANNPDLKLTSPFPDPGWSFAGSGAAKAPSAVNIIFDGPSGAWDSHISNVRLPEPATLSLVAFGAMGLLARRRRTA